MFVVSTRLAAFFQYRAMPEKFAAEQVNNLYEAIRAEDAKAAYDAYKFLTSHLKIPSVANQIFAGGLFESTDWPALRKASLELFKEYRRQTVSQENLTAAQLNQMLMDLTYGPDPLEEQECLQCGAKMKKEESKCSKCGWTWETPNS